MGDEEFDLCECIWFSRWRMQRLLSLIRETQNQCTDIECFNAPRLPGPQESLPQTNFLMTFMVLGVIMLLYIFRPNSMRSIQSTRKIDDISDSNNDPPGPPPAMN